MSQNKNNNQSIRDLVEKNEKYNRSLFSNKQPSNDVTQQILFCQNAIENLNISSSVSQNIYQMMNENEASSVNNEELMVDIVSNGYKYESSSVELNVIQQCCVISIISPHAFTIQLTRDLFECNQFFKNMNEYYNSIDDLEIPQEYLRPNLLCVTYDETISAWNRSQIMEYNLNNDTVNVFYIDLNSWEENVSRSRIRFILTKYSSRSVSILTCRLASIAPLIQWNDVILKTFQNVVRNYQCDIEFLYKRSDDMFYVNLFAQHDEAYVCINDFLIHCHMARPIDDQTSQENIIYLLDSDGKPVHAMITLYWKSEEIVEENEPSIKSQEDDHHSTVSNESYQSTLVKIIMINQNNQMIFAKYNNYIMIPWFTITNILNEFNEEKLKNLANKFGFKPILIDPLTHPILCSQLLKLVQTKSTSTQISLYSIDCVRKIFQISNYQQSTIFNLLNKARLAEASDDITFWDKSYEIEEKHISN